MSCCLPFSDGVVCYTVLYCIVPYLQVPTQLSRLANGIHHAKVVVTPKAVGGWSVMPLPAEFAFAVHAGGSRVSKALKT